MCFFRFEGKIVKRKIIKFFFLFIRTAFAANWMDLPVMRKCLAQKWQNHNFGDKTVLKNLFFFFTRFKFTCEFNQNVRIFGEERFLCQFENLEFFWKLIPDFENRYNIVSKRQQMQWKVKANTTISFKTHLGWFSKQKSYLSCILLVFVHKFKISINWFLSGEFRWSLCDLKHQYMKKVFHKIYWNLVNFTGDTAGKTYAFVHAKPPYLVMKSYAPFSKRQSWFWLSSKPLILV